MSVYTKVNSVYSPIDKVSNETWSSKAQQKTLDSFTKKHEFGYNVEMARNGTSKEINNTLAVWNWNDIITPVDENGKIQRAENGEPLKILTALNYPLTEFDRLVHDAIVSILVAGFTEFSPVDIIAVMCGKKEVKVLPTNEQINKVHSSVLKISHTRIFLNFKNEAIKVSEFKKYFKKEKQDDNTDKTFTIDEDLLSIQIVTYDENNLKSITYRYKGDINKWEDLPALYRYSAPKKQVMSIDIKEKDNLLATPLYQHLDNQELQYYLLRKINAMRSENVSNSLHIETILKDLKMIDNCIDEMGKVQRTRFYKRVETLLNFWMEDEFRPKLVEEWHWESCPRKYAKRCDDRNLKKGKLFIIPVGKKRV